MLDWIIDNLYWIIPGIILLWIWSRLQGKAPVVMKDGRKVNLKDLAVILEAGLIIMAVYLAQRWFFGDHNFMIISIFLFVPIMLSVFWFIFSQNNMYILETAIQGQKLIDIKEGKALYVPKTSNTLYVMDRGNYNELEHVGEVKTPWWNFTNVIFCDYYDQDKSILYHAEYSILKNITFYQAKIIWIKLIEEVPDLIKQNLKLTILGEYRIATALRQMIKQFPYWLTEIDEQHPEPFNLMDLEDILKRVEKDKYKDVEGQVKTIIEKYGREVSPEPEGSDNVE